jgi:hypothetical protein
MMGCEPQSEKDAMQSKHDHIRFELKSGTVTVDIGTLEKMKTALQSYVEGPSLPPRFLELREPMRKELKSSAAWIDNGQAGVGLWRLENRDDHLTLIRYPPPSKATQYLYHATLSKADSEWKVVSFEQERESGPV